MGLEFGIDFLVIFSVLGPLFGDILVSRGHFFVIFSCLGTSWDIFGSLEGPGVSNPGHEDMLIVAPWLHLGSLWIIFFDQKVDYFCVVFLYAFLDSFFIDFS